MGKMCYYDPMNTIVELYSASETEALQKKNRIAARALWIFCLCVLGTCVLLCCLTTRANAGRMEGAVIAVFTVGGWIAIYTYTFVAAAARREAEHAQRMLTGERGAVRGVASVDAKQTRIRGSITVQRVLVSEENHVRRLSINARKAKLLPQNGETLVLYETYGYVVAYEVMP